MQRSEPRCPKCRSAYLHRSKRRGFVERTLLTTVSVYPFRCELCGHRFYRGVDTNMALSFRYTALEQSVRTAVRIEAESLT